MYRKSYRKSAHNLFSIATASFLFIGCGDPNSDDAAGGEGDTSGDGGASPAAEDEGKADEDEGKAEEEGNQDEGEEEEDSSNPDEGEEEEDSSNPDEGEEEDSSNQDSGNTGGDPTPEPECVEDSDCDPVQDICQESYCTARGTCDVRDAANGSVVEDWSEWTECQYPNDCYESGVRGRLRLVCRSGKPVEDYETDTTGCDRDTDGTVVSEGEWSTCTGFTSICDEQGYEEKINKVCENGVETRQSERRNCDRQTDGKKVYGGWSDCRQPVEAEVFDGPALGIEAIEEPIRKCPDEESWEYGWQECGHFRQQWREVASCENGQPSDGISCEWRDCEASKPRDVETNSPGDSCGPDGHDNECMYWSDLPGPKDEIGPVDPNFENAVAIDEDEEDELIPFGIDEDVPEPPLPPREPQECLCPYGEGQIPGNIAPEGGPLTDHIRFEQIETLDLEPWENYSYLGHSCARRPQEEAEKESGNEDATGAMGQSVVRQGSPWSYFHWGDRRDYQADACAVRPNVATIGLPMDCNLHMRFECDSRFSYLQWDGSVLGGTCEYGNERVEGEFFNRNSLIVGDQIQPLGGAGEDFEHTLSCWSFFNTMQVGQVVCLPYPEKEPEPEPQPEPKAGKNTDSIVLGQPSQTPTGRQAQYPIRIGLEVACDNEQTCTEYQLNWDFNPNPEVPWPNDKD